MRVLIQSKVTGEYLGRSGEWTSDPDQAFDFKKTLLAFKYCRDRQLEEADIVLKFYDSEYDIPLSFEEPEPVHSQSLAPTQAS